MEALKSYLKTLADDDARNDFAAGCSTTLGHLRNVSYGLRQASPELCVAIEAATDGRITCKDSRPDLNWVRVKDKAWPHPKGRPMLDVSRVAA